MPFAKRQDIKKRLWAAGDLRHRGKIKQRDLTAPQGDEVDFVQLYTTVAEVWCGIMTVNPKPVFDGINTDPVVITHKFIIRFVPNLSTTHVWTHDGNRYVISRIENVDNMNQFLILHCIDKGDKDLEASKW